MQVGSEPSGVAQDTSLVSTTVFLAGGGVSGYCPNQAPPVDDWDSAWTNPGATHQRVARH
jgi:hypothetical protein